MLDGILEAFGVAGEARRLPGGSGSSWRVGDVVLKPGQDPVAGSWTAQVYAGLDGPGFRVPRPVRSVDGRWVVDGWVAWTAVEGEPAPLAHWAELVTAGRAFHAALADVAAPGWLGRRIDRWAVADRVAWGEGDVDVAPELAHLVDALKAARRPLRVPGQLVHGDLAGNVLFADGQTPAVIDLSPYHRPAGYPLAVAAVDVLTWAGGQPSILDELAAEDELDQLLVRALIFRTVTESLGRTDAATREAVRQATEPVAELVLGRLSGRTTAAGFHTDGDVGELVARVLARRVASVRPVAGVGHTRAVTRIVDLAGGGSVFVKAADPGVHTELAVYEALGPRPFLPRLLAGEREPVPVLICEALDSGGWVRDWSAALVDAVGALLDEVRGVPPPAGLPRLGDDDNPWNAIAADPDRLLRLGVCPPGWLSEHLDALRTAAASARVDGDHLVHRDVCASNLWHGERRLVLVDWGSAAIGDPWYDRHLWLVAMCAEGGPEPDQRQGPGAAGHAALIAGQQVLLAPSRDARPALYDKRRARLVVALSWAARTIGVPPFEPLS